MIPGTTVTPNPNFNGVLGVGLTVNDGTTNSNIFNASITVISINDTPTLDIISDVTIQEDPLEPFIISLTGITAGPVEGDQTLVVTAFSNKPELFATFELVYTSGTTAKLRINPKANVNGTAQITIHVQDNGSGSPPPNVNFIEQSFNFIIEPVNDPPLFVSQPITLAEAGQPYEYFIVVIDVEEEIIRITAPAIPVWLMLTQMTNGNAKLSGTPPVGTTGQVSVVIEATDPAAIPVVNQEISINVNSRPVVRSFTVTIDEDHTHEFNSEFSNNYTDSDGNPLVEIQITQLPTKGVLILNGSVVSLNNKIPSAQIVTLKYVPLRDITGTDIIKWNAGDGLFYSLTDAVFNSHNKPS